MGKKRMYEPYGYREEGFYVSKVTQLDNELAENRKNDKKEMADISQLIADVSYESTTNSMVFKNLSGETLSMFNLQEIIANQLIQSADYDKDTKEIIIVFEDGDEVRIDASDLVNLMMAGDGLEVVEDDENQYFAVKVDEQSETDYSGNSFMTVSESGVKVDGIKDAIETKVNEEMERAVAAEEELDAKIQAEEVARTEADAAIMAYINQLDANLSATTEHVTVGIVQTDGKVTSLTAKEDNIASETDLQAEITRAKQEEAVIVASIQTINSNIDQLILKDQTIEGSIATERAARIAADNALDARVTALEESGGGGDLSALTERVRILEEIALAYQQAIPLSNNGMNLNGKIYIEVEDELVCLNDITKGLTNETY